MNDANMIKGFYWDITVTNPDGSIDSVTRDFNRIPTAGLDFLVRAPFGDVPSITTFYVGLFTGDYIPNENTSAADIPSGMQEFVGFNEEARPLWERQHESPGTMDNVLNKAVFTANQERTIRGGFLVTESAKGGNGGLVLSCVRFLTAKPVSIGQKIEVAAGITYMPVGSI